MGLTNDEKKALFVLKEIDDDGHVIKDKEPLGMGFLVHVEGDEQFLVSSSSVLKHSGLNDTSTIQAERYHIPKKLFKKKDPKRFTFKANEIKVCDQSSFCYVKRNFVKQDGVKSGYHLKFSGKESQEKSLYAIVIDGEKVVKLKFKKTKQGTFDLNKPKDYEVPENAKGAPVMLLSYSAPNKVIGVLDQNCYDGKWSTAFFKPDTLKSANITIQDSGEIHISSPPADSGKSTLPYTKKEGQSVTFECSLEGKPRLQVTWWHDDKEIDTSDSVKYSVSGPSSVNNSTASLTIKDLLRCDEGDYFCKAQNDLESNRSTLTVNYPPKIIRPAFITPNAMSLSCEYEGQPKPTTVEWFVNNKKLDDQAVNITSATSSVNITNMTRKDEGMYKCVISNSVGKVETQVNVNYVDMYSKRLKKVIIEGTEIQPGAAESLPSLINLQSTKTDDIFTNLTFRHGKQRHMQQSGSAQADDQNDHKTHTEIQECSEIFVDEKGKKPKTILVAGDPGIGKTLFSHKIVRDWAKDDISIPKIKIIYLLKLRQLNGQEKLTLIDLLNLSSLLDSTTMTNEEVIDYIVEHPQQLFVILDGMDEYKYRHNITNVFDSEFPNDVKAKMPVPALISKLLHKKILRESVTMVTSRPGEANELDENIYFHRYVQITGFSESQVLEYVKKFFFKSEKKKNLALKKVKESEHYMTFGRAPYMCMLMCVVLEWEISNNITSDNSDSLTLTEFYREVIKIIENNYNKAIRSLVKEHASSAVEQCLDNLSLLAAKLFKQSKFSFNDQDLEKLKLTKQEKTHLRSSNLLCCNPVASNSIIPATTHEFSFNHFSLQEFFVARYFVSENKIPAQKMTEMIPTFMSGLMVADKNEELMLELLECIPKQVEDERRRRLVSAIRCLYEFKDGGDVFTRVVSENKDELYWDSDGDIMLYNISYSDCKPVAMFVDKLSDISHTLTEPPYRLFISDSQLSCTGWCTLLKSLTNPQTTITRLDLLGCNIDDECVEYICQFLPKTKITWLVLMGTELTDKGIQYFVKYPCLTKLTHLYLLYNERVSEECIETTEQHCSHNYPKLSLYI